MGEESVTRLVGENNTLSMTIEHNGLNLLYHAGIREKHNLDENNTLCLRDLLVTGLDNAHNGKLQYF